MPTPKMPASWTLIIAAGLLVGFGTRLGGGCTSGHGICGVAYAFLVYMLSPLPRRSGWAYSSLCLTQPYQPSPKGSSGRPAHCPFRNREIFSRNREFFCKNREFHPRESPDELFGTRRARVGAERMRREPSIHPFGVLCIGTPNADGGGAGRPRSPLVSLGGLASRGEDIRRQLVERALASSTISESR
ncbi:hypothetical protein SAMN05443247_03753 [Bradyrhizobium erythrophlei]|nr:hypothetical protein SAMN05443247_03753 [Bradyrhizobium erythrophlei]